MASLPSFQFAKAGTLLMRKTIPIHSLKLFLLLLISLLSFYSYVCHAEINAILNTNHASAAGQVIAPIHLNIFCLSKVRFMFLYLVFLKLWDFCL